MDSPGARYFWFAIGLAYGAMLGAYVGRRLLYQRQEFEGLRSRVWELEAQARERKPARKAPVAGVLS